MKINDIRITKSLVIDDAVIGYADDEVLCFEKSDLRFPKTILGKIRNPQNITLAPDKKRLIGFNTTGTLYQIPLVEFGKHKKLKISKKPNSGQVYFVDDNRLISADWAGKIYCVDLDENKVELIDSENDTMFYSLFPSINKECFLLQGLTGDADTFIRKCTFENGNIKIMEEVCFGDRVLAEINLCLKKAELLYFIDCQDHTFGLYSYNEVTNEIKKHFTLATLDELKEIISCYVSLNYSNEYNCFVITRSDKVQLFDVCGTCIREVCMKSIDIGFDFLNSPYDAYILNDKLYINTVIGVYEEDMN